VNIARWIYSARQVARIDESKRFHNGVTRSSHLRGKLDCLRNLNVRHALRARKVSTAFESQGENFSRGFFRIGIGRDGWMGVLAEPDSVENRTLVLFLRCSHHPAVMMINSSAQCCTNFSVNDKSFGVENHDVVTTWE
jgi:hypothetical protein